MSNEEKKPNRPPLSPKRREQSRREFLRTGALMGGVLLFGLLGYVPVGDGKVKRLRPPGALIDKDLSEREFLSACIKCGQCVQVCPVEAIKLSDLDQGFGIGVPYIEARAQACDFSCDGLQCVLACPTGALTHEINYPAQARMGFARLTRPDKCLAIQGQGFKGQARGPDFAGVLRYDAVDRWKAIPVSDHPYDLELCDLCVRQCPIEIRMAQCASGKPPSGDKNQCPPRKAISLESLGKSDAQGGASVAGGRMPGATKARQPLVHDGCVGCGVCEMVCPTDPPAIVIVLDENADTHGRRG